MELDVYSDIKLKVRSLLNLNLDHYKDEQMRRRLDSWLVRVSAPSWEQYFQRIHSDVNERNRFRDYLTINVSSFFRDIERWNSLRLSILPQLLKDALSQRPHDTGLHIWSAGCSIGAEAYTLAIILDEISPVRRHHILATDFDLSAIRKARDGGPYTTEEVQSLTPPQRTAYLKTENSSFYIQPSLGKKINFREHNLLEDSFPVGQDLIVCRNVVIYFTGETKDQLYRKFHSSLRTGGILFVGATEIIPRPQEIGFRSAGISFYQKI